MNCNVKALVVRVQDKLATLRPSEKESTAAVANWLAVFQEALSLKALSAEQTQIYILALRDLYAEEIDAACAETLNTWKFMCLPPIGEIRSRVAACARRQQLREYQAAARTMKDWGDTELIALE